jgi:hypothetical protein
MRRIMFDTQIADIESSGIVTKGLELLNTRSDVRSLLETDEFSSDEMHRFFLNSINIQKSVITGGEVFSGKMLSPSSKNLLMSSEMLDRMVEYYNATHVQSRQKVTPDSNFIVKHIKNRKFQAIYIFIFLLIIISKFYITLKPISYSFKKMIFGF